FAGRGALDIEGLGTKVASLLVATGLVRDLADIYLLTAEQLIELEGFAEKKVAGLLAGIDQARRRPLTRLLIGLGIPHVGGTVARLLARQFGSLAALGSASEEELLAVHGI